MTTFIRGTIVRDFAGNPCAVVCLVNVADILLITNNTLEGPDAPPSRLPTLALLCDGRKVLLDLNLKGYDTIDL